MTTILVNGVKSKTGGGKSILNNYLGLLTAKPSSHKYVVLTPDENEYARYARPNIEIIDIPARYKHNLLFPLLYGLVLPRLIRKHQIDVILNFGDIIVPSGLPQLYVFDWPYAVYRDKIDRSQLGLTQYCVQKIKLLVFQRFLGYATVVAAQTSTSKARLAANYHLQNIVIVPNAVSRENLGGGDYRDFNLSKSKRKLLYLAYYYPHKNLEVLLPLATLIRDRALPYQIVTTISPSQHTKAAAFLQAVKNQALDTVITNVGPVPMENVPSLYSQSDALLMPTLLESFSGAYVEAMFHEKVILTSRLDFAEDVCGGAAFYFDPTDPQSILATIELAFGDEGARRKKVAEGKKRLLQMPTWEQVFMKYEELLDELATQATH